MTSRKRYTAMLDANVLVPIRLTDLLIQLAVDDLFRAKWTLEIHREWMKTVRRLYPDIGQQRVERRRDQMDAETRDALVYGYETIIEALNLPDGNDRHVLAAAIVGHCDVIVTYNLKDFPSEALLKFDIEAQHPDIFLANHLDLFPRRFCGAVHKVRQRHQKKTFSFKEYLESLTEIELVATAAGLRECAYILDEQTR